MKTKMLLAGLSLFSASAFARNSVPYFADPTLPTEVQAVHESFLAGNFDQMAIHIKRALIAYPGDLAIQNNVLALLDQAYELRGHEAVSPDWHMPAGITWINVNAKKRFKPLNGSIDYRMGFSIDHRAGTEISQLRLIHYPNRVILDKRAGIGESSDELDSHAPGGLNFWMASDYRREPNEEGLYLLDLEMKGGEKTQGWFFLSKPNATESPEVLTPSLNQAFETHTPTFHWKEFVSSEYRGYQKRKVKTAVVRRSSDATSNTWDFAHDAPLTSVTVDKELPSGDYVFQLNYAERRKFGDLAITRESGNYLPFSVK